jgi:glycosyltransferase involved in cell wall biosynthesis
MRKRDLVSIIVPVFNEEKVIGRLLESAKRQIYKEIEVIVVDDASTDNTVIEAKKFTDLVFKRKHAERSAQRNFGAKMAKGKYLLFLDADMELTPRVVKECVDLASTDKKIGSIVIPERSVATNFWERVKAFERSFYNLEGDTYVEAARFFLRKAFDAAGGYDEAITGPEDWDLPETIRRLGYKQERIKSIIYHHERIKSPFSVARKKFYYALKSHRYVKKQMVPLVGPKTIYFLRPVFYKNWKRLLKHPLLTLGMFFMLSLELIYGGVGFIIGKFKNK